MWHLPMGRRCHLRGNKGKGIGRRPSGNPDFRHRSQAPSPEIPEIERSLYQLLSPSLMAPRQMERRSATAPQRPIRMRARLLTLPVLMAVVLSLVFRRLPSLAEAQRILEREGLLWVSPLRVSQQAINRRLDTMPAPVVGQLFSEVCQRLKAAAPQPLPERWQHLASRFSTVLVVDGSTLEALRKKTEELKGQEGTALGGKGLIMVELFGLRPVWEAYTEDWRANEKRFAEAMLAETPLAGLLVYDLGLFSFGWFDDFTQQGKYFVTRMREKTSYQVLETLSEGPFYRDGLVAVGRYRTNPCQHQLRLVEVLWGRNWHRYLTNVLDPKVLSARDVCELYRRRWRIEDAFLLTKRVLDLAYLWSGSKNAVQLQVYATLIFYAVLLEVCQQLAEVLAQPLDRISIEMVFRGLYHYARALQKGEHQELVPFLAGNARLLGLVKRERARDRERLALSKLVWGSP